MFFSSASRLQYCRTTLFAFFFTTKLSLDAISCSHSHPRALVPRPSSTAYAQLLSFQYTHNVLDAAVWLSPTQIIAIIIELSWYRPTLSVSSYYSTVCASTSVWSWLQVTVHKSWVGRNVILALFSCRPRPAFRQVGWACMGALGTSIISV